MAGQGKHERVDDKKLKEVVYIMKKAAAIILSVVLLVFPAPVTAMNTSSTASMTLVPNGPISNKIKAEIRVGVYNDNTAGNYTVNLSLTQNGVIQNLTPITKHVGAQSNELFNVFVDTSALSGVYTVSAVVSKSGNTIAQLSDTMTVIETSSTNRAVPLVTTAFIDPGAFVDGVYASQRVPTQQDVRDEIDALNATGIKTVILTYAEYVLNGWGAFYPSQIDELTDQVTLVGNTAPTVLVEPVNFDFLGTVLEQAELNGQKVFIGIGRGTDAWITFDTRAWLRPESQSALNPVYLQEHVDFAKEVTDEIYSLYKDYDSFYGWYISHECQDITWANYFYNPVADYMHAISPEKPVLVSPAAVTPWLIVNQMRAALSDSSADIFSYQDSVGAGYDETTFTYTYNPQIRINQMDAMYQKYLTEHQNTTKNKHFWANIEAWEMAGPAYTNAYAAAYSRYKQQLDIVSKYVDSVSSYESGGFLESPASTVKLGGQPAVDLYTNYKNYYEGFIGN